MFASDNWYADFDEDGVPDMALGRLPAATAGASRGVVEKIEVYEAEAAGDWNRRALMAAHDPDEGGDFTYDGAALAGMLPPDHVVDTLELESPGPDDLRRRRLESLDEGFPITSPVRALPDWRRKGS